MRMHYQHTNFSIYLLASVMIHLVVIAALIFWKNSYETRHPLPGDNRLISFTFGETNIQKAKATIDKNVSNQNKINKSKQSNQLPIPAGKNLSSFQSSSHSINQYLHSIITRINNSRYYPGDAKKNNMEGIVTLQFTILKNGLLKGPVTVVSPCKHTVLNNAGKQTVLCAAPFPPFPADSSKNELTCTINLDYSLN